MAGPDLYPHARHVDVWREPGRFGGWPANGGGWAWGDELVVGFSGGYFKDLPGRHAIDPDKKGESLLGRSKDGGETWAVERFAPEAADPSFLDGVDFASPDLALTFRMAHYEQGISSMYLSRDRARTWRGPFNLPTFGQKWIASRTDYLALGPKTIWHGSTASRRDGKEGRAFSCRSDDGGRTWRFLGWITPEPPDGFTIMPSTLRLPAGRLVTAIRCRDHVEKRSWIDLCASDDEGATWEHVSFIAETGGMGNPAGLLRLRDGRLCCPYGVRYEPCAIRARLSSDDGRTWGEELVLRQDGACWDLGYPRSAQRPDGQVVTAYYYNDGEHAERYIAATIWDPAKV